MVHQSSILIGIVGKTNVGKSTLFSALTMLPVKIENRPFVTIEPNVGIAYVRSECPHRSLNLPKCDPINSLCIEGYRFIPVKVMDVAGLIPGAHRGRGLGNKFLDDIRQANALIHVIDASGSTDGEGNPVKPGSYDPFEDIVAIEREIDLWMFSIIRNGWDKLSKGLDHVPQDQAIDRLTQRLSGLSIRRTHVVHALKRSGLDTKKFSLWDSDDLLSFVSELRKVSKPTIIAANKADLPESIDIIKSLVERARDRVIVPVSAEIELALRRASKAGLIRYIPGDPVFEVVDESRLSDRQRKALGYIREVMDRLQGSGVQRVLNVLVFDLMEMIPVYPVENVNEYSDSRGNILPDVILVRRGSTPRDLAYMIHTDLGEGFLYAIDARTRNRVGGDYILRENDIIKIVSAKAR